MQSTSVLLRAAVYLDIPILATEHIEERVELPAGFFQPRADFLLRGTTRRGAEVQDAAIAVPVDRLDVVGHPAARSSPQVCPVRSPPAPPSTDHDADQPGV